MRLTLDGIGEIAALRVGRSESDQVTRLLPIYEFTGQSAGLHRRPAVPDLGDGVSCQQPPH